MVLRARRDAVEQIEIVVRLRRAKWLRWCKAWAYDRDGMAHEAYNSDLALLFSIP